MFKSISDIFRKKAPEETPLEKFKMQESAWLEEQDIALSLMMQEIKENQAKLASILSKDKVKKFTNEKDNEYLNQITKNITKAREAFQKYQDEMKDPRATIEVLQDKDILDEHNIVYVDQNYLYQHKKDSINTAIKSIKVYLDLVKRNLYLFTYQLNKAGIELEYDSFHSSQADPTTPTASPDTSSYESFSHASSPESPGFLSSIIASLSNKDQASPSTLSSAPSSSDHVVPGGGSIQLNQLSRYASRSSPSVLSTSSLSSLGSRARKSPTTKFASLPSSSSSPSLISSLTARDIASINVNIQAATAIGAAAERQYEAAKILADSSKKPMNLDATKAIAEIRRLVNAFDSYADEYSKLKSAIESKFLNDRSKIDSLILQLANMVEVTKHELQTILDNKNLLTSALKQEANLGSDVGVSGASSSQLPALSLLLIGGKTFVPSTENTALSTTAETATSSPTATGSESPSIQEIPVDTDPAVNQDLTAPDSDQKNVQTQHQTYQAYVRSAQSQVLSQFKTMELRYGEHLRRIGLESEDYAPTLEQVAFFNHVKEQWRIIVGEYRNCQEASIEANSLIFRQAEPSQIELQLQRMSTLTKKINNYQQSFLITDSKPRALSETDGMDPFTHEDVLAHPIDPQSDTMDPPLMPVSSDTIQASSSEGPFVETAVTLSKEEPSISDPASSVTGHPASSSQESSRSKSHLSAEERPYHQEIDAIVDVAKIHVKNIKQVYDQIQGLVQQCYQIKSIKKGKLDNISKKSKQLLDYSEFITSSDGSNNKKYTFSYKGKTLEIISLQAIEKLANKLKQDNVINKEMDRLRASPDGLKEIKLKIDQWLVRINNLLVARKTELSGHNLSNNRSSSPPSSLSGRHSTSPTKDDSTVPLHESLPGSNETSAGSSASNPEYPSPPSNSSSESLPPSLGDATVLGGSTVGAPLEGTQAEPEDRHNDVPSPSSNISSGKSPASSPESQDSPLLSSSDNDSSSESEDEGISSDSDRTETETEQSQGVSLHVSSLSSDAENERFEGEKEQDPNSAARQESSEGVADMGSDNERELSDGDQNGLMPDPHLLPSPGRSEDEKENEQSDSDSVSGDDPASSPERPSSPPTDSSLTLTTETGNGHPQGVPLQTSFTGSDAVSGGDPASSPERPSSLPPSTQEFSDSLTTFNHELSRVQPPQRDDAHSAGTTSLPPHPSTDHQTDEFETPSSDDGPLNNLPRLTQELLARNPEHHPSSVPTPLPELPVLDLVRQNPAHSTLTHTAVPHDTALNSGDDRFNQFRVEEARRGRVEGQVLVTSDENQFHVSTLMTNHRTTDNVCQLDSDLELTTTESLPERRHIENLGKDRGVKAYNVTIARQGSHDRTMLAACARNLEGRSNTHIPESAQVRLAMQALKVQGNTYVIISPQGGSEADKIKTAARAVLAAVQVRLLPIVAPEMLAHVRDFYACGTRRETQENWAEIKLGLQEILIHFRSDPRIAGYTEVLNSNMGPPPVPRGPGPGPHLQPYPLLFSSSIPRDENQTGNTSSSLLETAARGQPKTAPSSNPASPQSSHQIMRSR